jgi:nitrite reductase (NADH) small subunit
MIRRIELGPVAAIPEGEGRTFDVDGKKIAVFRTREGRLFATQGQCPHRGGPLADGLVGGTMLVCPLHDWSFDLLSGMPINGTCGVQTYPVAATPEGLLALEVEEDGAPPPWRITDYSKFAP